ncbi:MAG: hypothetical protein GY722_25420, partial [bacterium]|nr:hypothetical protein [bacterium]
MAAWQPSPEIQALYADHMESRPALGAERAIHYTEYWKRKADKNASPCLLNVGALAYHLEKRSIRVHPGELIVGSHTEHRIGAICHIEKAGTIMLEDLFRFEKRQTNPLRLERGTKRALLRSAIPYWLNRNVAMRSFPLRKRLEYSRDQLRAAHFVINEAGGVAHFLPDYEQVIRLGTDGLRAKVRQRIDQGGIDEEGLDYLEGSLIGLTAIERFADRYRDEAGHQGRDDVVEVLSQVPRRPARNLREALQLIWFFQLLIQIESLDQGVSLGRMDQYLYPLFCEEKKQPDFDADQV